MAGGERRVGPEVREVFNSEIGLVIARMNADISRPSRNNKASRFVDLLVTKVDTDKFGRSLKIVTGEGDNLGALNVPELTMFYRRFVKKSLPDTPEVLFADVRSPKDYQLRQVGITQAEMKASEDFFARLSDSLGQAPTLWTSARIVDCITRALRMNDRHDVKKGVAQLPLSDYMGKTVLISEFLKMAVSGYVHPETVKIWSDLILDDVGVAVDAGIKMPSNIERWAYE